MTRGRELINNTVILMIAKISTQFVSFCLLPLYTALLSTEEYGRVDVYASLSMIIIPFLTLQIEMALFRFFITSKDKMEEKIIISCSYATVFCTIVITSIIYFIAANFFSLQYLYLLYFYYLFQGITAMLLQTCRAQGDNLSYAVASFLSTVVAVFLNVLFVAGFHWYVEGILLSAIIAQAISGCFMLFKTKIHRYFSWKYVSIQEIKKLLQYSFPLVFNQIASWAINYSDRLIILWKLGESANGIYSVACKFSNILGTFFNIFNLAWTESVVRSMKDKDGVKYVNRVLVLTHKIYLSAVTGIINLLPFVFGILINKQYNESYTQIPILLGGSLFSGLAAMIGSLYIAYGKTKEVSISTILAGVCNVLVNLGLVNRIGLYAASISTLVSFLLLYIYRFIAVRKFYLIEVSIKSMMPEILVLVFASIAYEVNNKTLVAIGLVVNLWIIGITCMKNKNDILALIKRKEK